MENENTSSTTNEGLREIDKQTRPVMYGWRCPVRGRIYSPYTSTRPYRRYTIDRLSLKPVM